MLLLPASEKFMSQFPSPGQPSSPGSYTLDLYGLGEHTGISAIAGLAVRNTGIHKIIHNSQVDIRVEGINEIP
jgi:hypothetical protein